MNNDFLTEPPSVRMTNDRVKKLLLEREYIRAKLMNPGGSVILTATARVDSDREESYSSQIGSSIHLDLLDLEMQISECVREHIINKNELMSLLSWFAGMTSQQASVYLNARGRVNFGPATIRKRRQRALTKVAEHMNQPFTLKKIA